MSKSFNKVIAVSLLSLVPASAFALPIDWQGSFGVDANIISNYRHLKQKSETTPLDPGSQEVGVAAGGKNSLSWQSYIFKLSPSIIINDSATFKAELTSGYGYGGFAGEATQTDAADQYNVPLYYHNEARGKEVLIRKAYLELYSDTATYVLGRHSTQWGLGAIYNAGDNVWDRHTSTRDGATMKVKIGNFNINPFWSMVNNEGLTKETDTKEYGASLLYDNADKDIAFGLNYTIRKGSAYNTYYKTNNSPNPPTAVYVGETDVKITDLYFKKTWGKVDVGVELPLFSGDIGKADATRGKNSISTKAILMETNYNHSDAWKFSLFAGHVNGHDGSDTKYGALFLHPNYQVANLLFRYNMSAVKAGPKAALYDSYINNANYIKLGSVYSSEKWMFESAIIWAQAVEVAKAGKQAYNHSNHKLFTAVADQKKDLGAEVDLNATYKWNKDINLGLNLGYLMAGDYFGFNNTANPNEAANSFLIRFHTSVKF